MSTKERMSSTNDDVIISHVLMFVSYFFNFLYKCFRTTKKDNHIRLPFSVFNTFQSTPVCDNRRQRATIHIAYTPKLHNS